MQEKVKRLWDNYRVVKEVQKSDKIKFVIGAGVRDGVRYINIREFYFRKRDQTWNPGRDGITVPLSIPIEEGTKIIKTYDDFIDALTETAKVLKTMKLSDEAHAVYMPKKGASNA